MQDRDDDFEHGIANRRAVLGDEWVDRSLGATTGFNADFQDLVTRHAWLDIWGRPGLDRTTRRLLVLAMTMAGARWEEFELHCRATVRAGVPVDAIRETLMQGAIYCGFPAANTAFKLTTQILRDEGRLPASMPLVEPHRVARHRTFSAPPLALRLQGAGAPVVMSHALGADASMWDGLAAALAPTCEVLRYDHRGHGASAVPPAPYTLDELVDDAARVIREWGRGPVTFIGLSMGGMVGQGLAIRHPELVRALVLSSTTAQYPEAGREATRQRIAQVEAGGVESLADAVMERWFEPPFRAGSPEVVAAMRATVCRTDRQGYLGGLHAVGGVDWLDALPQLRCPTLVIVGERDPGTPPAMARQIADRIPGAELVVIDGASHMCVLERPDRFEAAVRDFLGRHAAG